MSRTPEQEAIRLLAAFDTLHDFWVERGNVQAAPDEDEDQPEDIPEGKLAAVKEHIRQSLNRYFGTDDLPSVEAILSQVTGGAIKSVSNIEEKAASLLRARVPRMDRPRIVLTLSEVLTAWRFDGVWETFQARILTLPNTIEVIGGGRSIKSLDDTERNIVAFFILAYLNPNVNPGASPVGLTFDMAPRDVGKIFSRTTQVYNSIRPQNIADSASTSFSALLGRAQYTGVDGSYPPTAGAQSLVTTNAFTAGKYRLVFQDNKFGSTNKFGFSIDIYDTKGTPVARIPFGPRNEQGPSVNYLVDLMTYTKGRDPFPDPKIGTVVKLNAVEGILEPDLLFDFKRMGDQEQMLGNDPAYRVTGDRNAFLFLQLLEKSGIYHSTKGLVLNRGAGGLTPEQAEALRQRLRILEVLEKLSVVSTYIAQYGTAASDLATMRNHVLFAAQRGYVFSQFTPISSLDRETVASSYTQLAANVATLLLRARMVDILAQIERVRAKLASIDFSAVATLVPLLNAARDATLAGAPLSPEMGSAVTAAATVITQIEELSAMQIAFTSTAQRLPLYTQLVDRNGKLLKGVESSFFNFASGPFLHPEAGLTVSISRLLVHQRVRRLDAVKDAILKTLVSYFAARDDIKEAFFDPSMKAQIEAATDIASGLPPATIVFGGILAVIEQTNAVVQPILGTIAPLPPATPPQAGGATSQVGGAGSPLQYRDLNDLLFEICFDAALGRETGVPDAVSLDRLETKWVITLDELQQTDEYRFEPSDTVDALSYILSFRTQLQTGEILIGTIFNPDDTKLYPTLGRSFAKLQNDIGSRLLLRVPVEPVIIGLLLNLHATLMANPTRFQSEAEWESIAPSLYARLAGDPTSGKLPRALKQLIGGGLHSRRALYGNARTPSARHGLYAGLRKRTGSRTTARVRQRSSHPRTWRQRKHLDRL